MANKYWFYGGVNTLWATLGNWWDDAAHTVPAAALPVANDSVYLLGGTAPTTGPAAITFTLFNTSGLLADMSTKPPTTDITIAAGGTLHIGNSATAWNHYWDGTAVAAGISIVFEGGGDNVAGTLGDNAVFSGHAGNEGTVGDHATFSGDGVNTNNEGPGIIGDFATFNDTFINQSVVGNNATYNDNSCNYIAATTGDDATFNDNTFNWGTVGDNATFNDCSISYSDIATVGNHATFNNNSSNRNGSIVGDDFVFNDASFNDGGAWIAGAPAVCGNNGFFYDKSANYGTVGTGVTYAPCSWPADNVVSDASPAWQIGNASHVGTLPGSTAQIVADLALVKAKTDIISHVYYADIFFNRDSLNNRDEYTVPWYKSGDPVTSGITSPKIQVINRSDGTSLIPPTDMVQVGSSGVWKHDTGSTDRLTKGEAAIAMATATIDGASRTWTRVVGRDA